MSNVPQNQTADCARPWCAITNAPHDRLIWIADWIGDIALVGWMVIDGLSGFFTRNGENIEVAPVMEWAESSALFPPPQQATVLAEMTRDTCYHQAAMDQFAELLEKAR